MHGCYLMSERGRVAYLILAVNNRGLGSDERGDHLRLLLTVDTVSRAEAVANPDLLYPIVWDRRAPKRRRHTLSDFNANPR